MNALSQNRIYVLGGGAIGAPLAAFLAQAGKPVALLRATPGRQHSPERRIQVQCGAHPIDVMVQEEFFHDTEKLEGWLVIATKAHANASIAAELARRDFCGPLVLLQNGLGIERPFLEAGFTRIVRGVLYVTSQLTRDHQYSLRVPHLSPLGMVAGDEDLLKQAMAVLSTPELPFIEVPNIERSVWKKTIINAAFNSICTLVEEDNGIFVRDELAMSLAKQVVEECTRLGRMRGVELDPNQILEEIILISSRSTQLISTLQDVRAGRPTEMDFMNLELARLAAEEQPPVELPVTSCLGKLVKIKSSAGHRPPHQHDD